MLTKSKSMYPFPVEGLPDKLITLKITNQEFSLRNCVGRGLEKVITDEHNSKLIFSIQCKLISDYSGKEEPLTLLTDHGFIDFYDYSNFFQVLSGVSLNENKNHLEKIFPVMLSFVPKSIISIFGSLSMTNNCEDSNEKKYCLPLKINTEDFSAITYVSATSEVLMSFLQQELWEEQSFGEDSEKEIFPAFVPCSIGKTKILPVEYKSLQPGDYLVIDTPFFDVNGAGIVPIGRRSASVFVDNATLKKNRIVFLGWQD